MMNNKITSSDLLNHKLNEIIVEHQTNYLNLEEFDLEDNLHDLYETYQQDKDFVPDPDEVVEIPVPPDNLKHINKNTDESDSS